MSRLLPLLALFALAADWPVFRGTPTMTGTASEALPDQLAERWAFKCKDSVESAPAVADGAVFVGSMDRHLYRIDLATGAEKWKAKLGPIKAAPAVAGGRVYVGDVEGKFHCLTADEGKVLWTFECGGEITAGANFHGPNVLIGSHDSTLYCLAARDGKKVWEYKIDGPVNGSAAVAGDRTFVAGCDSLLHVLDARTGKPFGTVDLGGQAAATAAVVGDVAFVGTMTNQVVAVDTVTRKKLWEFEAKRRQQPFYSSAAAADGLVVIGSKDKKVYALDQKSGAEKWSFVTEGAVDPSPVVVGGRVYVGCLSSTAEFYVLELASGKLVQQLTLDSAVSGSAAVGPGCIIVGTEKGTVYCLGAAK